jgi:hypothetical protein
VCGRVPGAARYDSGDGNSPPMGGKSTESSIRKQSVPHMMAACMLSLGVGVQVKRSSCDV